MIKKFPFFIILSSLIVMMSSCTMTSDPQKFLSKTHDASLIFEYAEGKNFQDIVRKLEQDSQKGQTASQVKLHNSTLFVYDGRGEKGQLGEVGAWAPKIIFASYTPMGRKVVVRGQSSVWRKYAVKSIKGIVKDQ